MTDQDYQTITSKCVLVGDVSRLRILDSLWLPTTATDSAERAVHEIVKAVGSKQTTVSNQLGKLRLGGFVECRRVGKTNVYRLTEFGRRAVSVLRETFAPAAG
jgi:DNA-binding transcriptional ArsR family regulator